MNLLQQGGHSLYDITYYFLWKTVSGRSTLKGKIGARTIEIIKRICKEQKWNVIKGKVAADHVQLILSCRGDVSPAKIMQFLKGKSGYLLQKEFRELHGYTWQRGYFCKSLGSIDKKKIESYLLGNFPTCSHASPLEYSEEIKNPFLIE